MNEPNIDQDASEHWADWPLCPECNNRRQAICDSCEYASDDIPLAEYLEAVEVAPIGQFSGDKFEEPAPRDSTFRVLLMCPQCEEAFKPRFYRVCHWCGHEFESGRQVENTFGDQLTPRVLWTTLGLVVLGIASLWYFLAMTS